MPKDLPFRRRCLVVASVALAARSGAAQIVRPPAPLPFDSATVRRLLDDATIAAQESSSTERAAVLTAIGRTQVEARDFSGAERTLGLLSDDVPPGDVLRQFGEPEWFAMLSRTNLATRLLCEYRSTGQAAAGLALVRRLPAGEQRDWLLAHEAIMALRTTGANAAASVTPMTPMTSTTPLTPLLDRWRAARAITREIASPEARLDALLGMADVVPDTGAGRAVLRDAYIDARAIRLADMDRQSSRNALLAVLAVRASRESDAASVFDRLTDPEDILYVFATAARRPRSNRLARSLTARVIAAASQLQDTAARTAYLDRVHGSLRQTVGDEEADRLVPSRASGGRRGSRGDADSSRDSAKATSIYPQDLAAVALNRRDFAEVRRQAERVPVGRIGAERAMLWKDLAWSEYMSSIDTARVCLSLATASLRREAVRSARDSADYDDAVAAIARNDFWFGDVARAIALLDTALDPTNAAGAVDEWGASTFARPSPDSSRAAIARVRDPLLRDALLAQFVEIELVPENIAQALAVADSIAAIRWRAAATLAVAAGLHRMRRDEQARSLLGELLSGASFVDADGRLRVVSALIGADGSRDAENWARAPVGNAIDRARRLLVVATVMNRAVQAAGRGPFYRQIGNGPDPCLDLF